MGPSPCCIDTYVCVQAVEVIAAVLSIMCGATLPPDCLTVSALTQSMCGGSLLSKLTLLLQTQVDTSMASSLLRSRAHAAAAFTYLLPLLDLSSTWKDTRVIVDSLLEAAKDCFGALTSSRSSTVAAAAQVWSTAGVFRNLESVRMAAKAAAAHVMGKQTEYEHSELYVVHCSLIKQVLQCVRYLLVVGQGREVPVSLSSILMVARPF